MQALRTTDTSSTSLLGALCAFGAFSFWGVIPIYFKSLAQVPAFEVVAHRIVWSVILLAALLFFLGGWRKVGQALGNRRLLATLALSTLFVAVNWVVFIWAITNDRVLESSLGYFINPLVSVLLGVLFLKERMRFWQWGAVVLAVLGVAFQVVQLGQLPWVSLALAFSFGIYGLIRKVAMVDAIGGLFVETLIACPLALGFLVYLGLEGSGAMGRLGWEIDGLLALAGVFTALPLILFIQATKRLRLSSVGFFQYITPSGHFLLAVFIYNEPFTVVHMVTFGCIWLALGVYTVESSLHRGRVSVKR